MGTICAKWYVRPANVESELGDPETEHYVTQNDFFDSRQFDGIENRGRLLVEDGK